MNKDNPIFQKPGKYFPKARQDPSIKNPANYPRILLCRILELLHTAVGKTGVSSGKSVSRDDRLWHIKSRYLPKRIEPKPQNAGSIDGFGT